MTPVMMFFALIGGHMLADYPLQGDFLSKAKNRNQPIPNVPWQQVMLAHTTIHGVFVAFITGVYWLGILELVCHWIIDTSKCDGKIDYDTDQTLHIVCKCLWFTIAMTIVL